MTKIMKGGVAYNSTANMVALTQAEYDALSTAQKNNGNFYFIVDSDPAYFSAANIDYDNTNSGLSATNVQDAIDEKENTLYDSGWKTIALNTGITNITGRNSEYRVLGRPDGAKVLYFNLQIVMGSYNPSWGTLIGWIGGTKYEASFGGRFGNGICAITVTATGAIYFLTSTNTDTSDKRLCVYGSYIFNPST